MEGMFIIGEGKRSRVWPTKEIAATLTLKEWEHQSSQNRKQVLAKIKNLLGENPGRL